MAKFVQFKTAHTREPILINADHVGAAIPSGSSQVTLVMSSGEGRTIHQDVDGDLQSVLEQLETSAQPLP
jgi:hypothetical protein